MPSPSSTVRPIGIQNHRSGDRAEIAGQVALIEPQLAMTDPMRVCPPGRGSAVVLRGLALCLLVMAAVGCAPPATGPGNQLMRAFEASHAPLATCVGTRLSEAEMARAAEEFAGTPGFARLIEQSPALFVGRDDLLAQVSAAQGKPAQQAERLLAALREYGAGEPSAATPGLMEQQLPGYRRVRIAVADLALAPLPSIQCAVPDDLARQVAEARTAELLVEVSSAYAPFQACVTGALSNRPELDGRFPELIVARGLDAALLDTSRRYLARAVTAPGPDTASREVAARAALQALGAYAAAVGLPGQPYTDQLRRQMAMVESMQLVASATDVDCIPNESLLSWMEAANHENH